MNIVDFLLNELNEDRFDPMPLWYRKTARRTNTDEYLDYLKYMNEYRKKEDERILKFLNSKKTDIAKRKEELEKQRDTVAEELKLAKASVDALEMDVDYIIAKVKDGYVHDKVNKMKRTENRREDAAIACANVMYIMADKYNEWEKLTKKVNEYERKLSSLERQLETLNESLENIGFYIDEKEDCSPSNV